MKPIEQIMRTAPVIPVLVIEAVEDARPIAEALVAGGLRVLEVTLRTPEALEAIREMREVEGAIVGAGTVTDARQLDDARAAGAQFIVSPGLTEPLGRAALDSGLPFLPGIATAGDIMRGLDLGLCHFKFFPAVAAGGIPALKALAAPFAQARFCPTGGIDIGNAGQWLALPPVLCVGGSWVVPRGASPAEIETLARQAATLAR
jgi:2-dehydro-3-deoxyphosphogluconate aldolase/(4S)-4-hydroxy-2-oxoglutarate aldolase